MCLCMLSHTLIALHIYYLHPRNATLTATTEMKAPTANPYINDTIDVLLYVLIAFQIGFIELHNIKKLLSRIFHFIV